MTVIHTECHFTHTSYNITFNNGKLVSICKISGVASEEVRFYYAYLFEEAIATFCHDDNAKDFETLFVAMKDDDVCINHAKKVIARELKSMTERSKLIASLVSKNE